MIDHQLHPVNQCGSTCFFEAAAAALEIEVNRAQSTKLSIDRTQLLAQYSLRELRRLADWPAVESLRRANHLSGDEHSEIFGFGGKASDVVDFANVHGVPLKQKVSKSEVKRDDARIYELLSSLDHDYTSFSSGVQKIKATPGNQSPQTERIENLRQEFLRSAEMKISALSTSHSSLEFKSSRLRVLISNQGRSSGTDISTEAVKLIRKSLDEGRPLVISYFHKEAELDSEKHEAVLVGYHLTEANAIDSVIVLNSWGDDYGDQGTFKLKVGELKDSLMTISGFEEIPRTTSRRRR